MCHNECSEAQERNDQSNIRETLQDCNIHRREGSNIAVGEILQCSEQDRRAKE